MSLLALPSLLHGDLVLEPCDWLSSVPSSVGLSLVVTAVATRRTEALPSGKAEAFRTLLTSLHPPLPSEPMFVNRSLRVWGRGSFLSLVPSEAFSE